MQRFAIASIESWYSSQNRQPLIIKGARQVGKTYLVREFGRRCASRFFEFSFESDPKLKVIFEPDLNPHRIVEELSLRIRQPIGIEDLLFFDEVQECPACLTSLKYFSEKRAAQPVICAGSLLGLTLGQSSFPVGKVQYLWLGPLTFEEFLLGLNDELGAAALDKARRSRQVSETAHAHLWAQLKVFYITGGLPRPIVVYNDHATHPLQAFQEVRIVQESLIRDYQSDFSKHCGRINAMHLCAIFNNVPLQLSAAEDRTTSKYKFTMSSAGHGVGYGRLQTPIEWLERAGLIYRVSITNQAKHSLRSYCKDNYFKLYTFDIGVFGALLRLPFEQIVNDDYGSAKGYFAESLALEGLLQNDQQVPCAWSDGQAEVEFVIVKGGEIVPVEVKSGRHTRARSLASYIKRYAPRAAVKLHSGGIGYDPKNRLHTLPLYLAWDLGKMDLY